MIPAEAQEFHREVAKCVTRFLEKTQTDQSLSGLEAVAAIGSAGVSLIEQCAHAFEAIGMLDAGTKFVEHTQQCLGDFLKIYASSGVKTPPVDQTLH